jgi:putative ABC transport system permease protein
VTTALRHIVRGLLASPLFTLTAVASLALGIGANTAMFSMIDRVLLRTLPVQAPHELVFLYHPGPVQGSSTSDESGSPSFSYPMFRELQQHQRVFASLAARYSAGASLSYRNVALPGTVFLVSGNYFSTLGVTPAMGRLLTEDDDRTPGGHPLVVLGYGYWKNRFGSDPAVLNQTMVVNGHAMTIVGVTQPGFTSERPGTAPDVFIPVTMKREMTPDRDGMKDRREYWITLFARLAPGTTIDGADAAINALYRDQLAQDAALLKGADADFTRRFLAKKIVLKPGTYGRGELRDQSRAPLLMLLGMTLLVLLIACANVANLQLARAAARMREVAVRLALGASRWQLVRRSLAESCVLAVAGGGLGLVVAQWTIRGILFSLPERQAQSGIVSTDLDLRILLFSFALSIATGIVFGLYPAIQASRGQVVNALKDQSGQSTAGRASGFFRKSLVTMQMAISLLLLISAALFARTLINLANVDLGIQRENLVTFATNPRLNRYTSEQTAQFYQQLTERLAALPGVQLVTASRVPVIAGSSSSTSITVDGFTPQRDGDGNANVNEIGPDFFRTLGIPLVAGREFTASDNQPGAPKTVIVNEAFVRRYFAGQNAIGRMMARSGGKDVTLDMTIIGVVKDAKYHSMKEPAPAVFYTPYRQTQNLSGLHVYMRTRVPPESLLPSVRAQVAAIDGNLPIRELRTMEAQLASRMSNEYLLSRLTGIFGALATLLAAIGLYGVLAFNVARRTREIGIRIALGAGTGHVRGLIMREIAYMVGIGTAVGIACAFAIGRRVESVLFGVSARDPLPYVASAAILTAVALLAAYLPARRATRVDPLVALRTE